MATYDCTPTKTSRNVAMQCDTFSPALTRVLSTHCNDERGQRIQESLYFYVLARSYAHSNMILSYNHPLHCVYLSATMLTEFDPSFSTPASTPNSYTCHSPATVALL